MTDGRGQSPTPKDVALHGADMHDIALSSKGITPYYIPGIDAPLIIDGYQGEAGDNFRMIMVPLEVAALLNPSAEALFRLNQDSNSVGVEGIESGGDVRYKAYELRGRDEGRVIDYLRTLTTALHVFGESRMAGASQEIATRDARTFLEGLR